MGCCNTSSSINATETTKIGAKTKVDKTTTNKVVDIQALPESEQDETLRNEKGRAIYSKVEPNVYNVPNMLDEQPMGQGQSELLGTMSVDEKPETRTENEPHDDQLINIQQINKVIDEGPINNLDAKYRDLMEKQMDYELAKNKFFYLTLDEDWSERFK